MKSLKLDLEEQERSQEKLTEGLDVHQGIPVPRHMSLPGQDGWRTPTVHDYEREKFETVDGEHATRDRRGRNKHPAITPPHAAGILSIQSVVHLASQIDMGLERLHWRERIRHFTWTFFTLTMATVGIANVLYTGRSPSTDKIRVHRLTHGL